MLPPIVCSITPELKAIFKVSDLDRVNSYILRTIKLASDRKRDTVVLNGIPAQELPLTVLDFWMVLLLIRERMSLETVSRVSSTSPAQRDSRVLTEQLLSTIVPMSTRVASVAKDGPTMEPHQL